MTVTKEDIKTKPRITSTKPINQFMRENNLTAAILLFQGNPKRYPVSWAIEALTGDFSHIGIINLEGDTLTLSESIMHGGVRSIPAERVFTGYASVGNGPYGGMAVMATLPEQVNKTILINWVKQSIKNKVSYNTGHDIIIGLRELFYKTFHSKPWGRLEIYPPSVICSEFVEQALEKSSPNHQIVNDPITKSFLPSTFSTQKSIMGIFSLNLTRPNNDKILSLADTSLPKLRSAKSPRQLCFFINDKQHHCHDVPQGINLNSQHQTFALPYCETDGNNRVCADFKGASITTTRRLNRLNSPAEYNPFFAFGAAAMLLIGLYYVLTGRFHQKSTLSKPRESEPVSFST